MENSSCQHKSIVQSWVWLFAYSGSERAEESVWQPGNNRPCEIMQIHHAESNNNKCSFPSTFQVVIIGVGTFLDPINSSDHLEL